MTDITSLACPHLGGFFSEHTADVWHFAVEGSPSFALECTRILTLFKTDRQLSVSQLMLLYVSVTVCLCYFLQFTLPLPDSPAHKLCRTVCEMEKLQHLNMRRIKTFARFVCKVATTIGIADGTCISVNNVL
jgi:hypothetical protein